MSLRLFGDTAFTTISFVTPVVGLVILVCLHTDDGSEGDDGGGERLSSDPLG